MTEPTYTIRSTPPPEPEPDWGAYLRMDPSEILELEGTVVDGGNDAELVRQLAISRIQGARRRTLEGGTRSLEPMPGELSVDDLKLMLRQYGPETFEKRHEPNVGGERRW